MKSKPSHGSCSVSGRRQNDRHPHTYPSLCELSMWEAFSYNLRIYFGNIEDKFKRIFLILKCIFWFDTYLFEKKLLKLFKVFKITIPMASYYSGYHKKTILDGTSCGIVSYIYIYFYVLISVFFINILKWESKSQSPNFKQWSFLIMRRFLEFTMLFF